MKKRTWKTILFLVGWTVVLGVIYWSFSETPYSVFVSALYAIIAVVLFIFFLLVNGGMRSLSSTEEIRAKKETERENRQLKGRKGRFNREKNRRLAEPEPRADLFHLGKEKQEKAARILLAVAAPFFFILAADYLYLHFFFKG